ncbi:cysteine methyltransferase [Taibaiella sp. KBW10]|uniref:MGMT family protein n=1 Tax=Taibaiella sp. KBW10 TaxID=2153357 RepID=UPI000F59FD6F|nr:MGMT family protein [Taibaiella sp. KBW10]RQO31283.1 cysteine methyltransferase [Taibaiella sp. KBW10]
MSQDTLSQYQAIYDIVKLIPFGRVCSYGVIAKCVGYGCTARVVGRAMFNSHNLPEVPAHRVLNSQGKLTGRFHFETPTRMQELLEAEGITIKNDKVLDFKTIFWDPDTLAEKF